MRGFSQHKRHVFYKKDVYKLVETKECEILHLRQIKKIRCLNIIPFRTKIFMWQAFFWCPPTKHDLPKLRKRY